MSEVRGKFGIYAKVLAHSISPAGVEILTFEVSYPRIILAELNTHSMICKNSSSSRAIPFEKMAASLTGRPVRFGANQAGMQDKGDDYAAPVVFEDCHDGMTPEYAWEQASLHAKEFSKAFYNAGYHKQVYNRLTEPFQMMKTVLTATEYANFYWLRNHEAADPTLQELARCMYEAASRSRPITLYPGEWHLPYVYLQVLRDRHPGGVTYWIDDESSETRGKELTLEEAIAVSTARCAAVSFRNVDYGVEKSKEVCARLIGDARKHGSAFQHQATPMQPYAYEFGYPNAVTKKHINDSQMPHTWEPGVSHADREKNLWSAQFKGWIMHRKLIPGENVPGFK